VLRSRTNSEFYAEPELGQDSGQGSGFSVGWGVDPVSHEPAHHTVQGEIRARDPRVMDQGRQPDFLTADEEPGIFGNILWGLAGTLALLVLLGQGLFWYRNDIATRLPIAQPLLASLCMRLGCELSLNRHLERISIDGSTLQQVAGQTQDGLPTEMMLRFTMRNRYDMSQPWPHLSVELKDASGTTVVRKIIAPHQYLPPSLVDQAFAAGQELNLSLPVSVTGLQINGFQLDKFFP
jgi:hypothetical protein